METLFYVSSGWEERLSFYAKWIPVALNAARIRKKSDGDESSSDEDGSSDEDESNAHD